MRGGDGRQDQALDEPHGRRVGDRIVADGEEQPTKGALLNRFVDAIYDGSASNLVIQLLGNKKTSKEELDAIRGLLDELDNKD